MRTLPIQFLFASLLISFSHSAFAADATCSRDQECKFQESIELTKEAVADHVKHGPQDPSCPAAGIAYAPSKAVIESGLTSAKSSLAKIEAALAGESSSLRSDKTKCGACQQVNVVSPVTVTRPKSPRLDARCDNRPTETVHGEFSTRAESEAFAKAVLDGNNQEGKRVYAACPDPCSFYVYNATTTLANGKTRLNLLVQCGHPRGSLFATYKFNGGHVQEWTCSP